MNAAGRAWREGALDRAASRCREALELQPDHAGGHDLAGVIAHRQGDPETACFHLERAVRIRPDRAEYRQNLALALLAAGNHAAALDQLGSVLESEPGNQPAQELRAEALADAGDIERAIEAWRKILDNHPDHATAETRLVDLIWRLDPARFNAATDGLIRRLLDSNRIETSLLAVPLARRIMARHRIIGASRDLPLDRLAADDLLLAGLERLYFTDPEFERVLTTMRRRLFLACREQGRVPRAWQPLIGALAVHNLRCEYVHLATDEERTGLEATIHRLEGHLADPESRPADAAGLLMLVALYQPPQALKGAGRLAETAERDWPAPLQRLIRLAFVESAREDRLAESIPVLATISDETSRTVRAMYEENPYPRWERIGPVVPGSLEERLRLQLPGRELPALVADKTVDVLIAGCGTGRHAIRAAMEYRNARVLAMDISRRSLAYAARRADELGVTNVEFLQADLFDLPQLDRRFHVVETIGTLETLEDPEAGWRVLVGMLQPSGLMYVGSYSETARQPVVQARERIRALGLTGTPDEMRQFRKRILDGELGEDGRMLIHCGDFYTLSGCRDLLFHVREKRFRIRELAGLMERHHLDFLGFHPLRPQVRAAYAERYPDDPMANDLDNWMTFEEQEPDTFCRLMNLSMLFYWVQKRNQ